MDTPDPGYVERNRRAWAVLAPEFAAWAPDAWAKEELTWGIFQALDATLGILPPVVAGLDVIELGCGTAYLSAALAQRGARPVGVDASHAQLATAQRMQERFGLHFPLHLGNAEHTPFPDASFDLVISEYGASIWCDPERWIPEAARLLRPNGQLIFLVNGLLLTLCTPLDVEMETPVSEQLERPFFGLRQLDWPDGSVGFALGHGDWIRTLRVNNFVVEDLIEIQPPTTATSGSPVVPLQWAQRWPCEEIWKARKIST